MNSDVSLGCMETIGKGIEEPLASIRSAMFDLAGRDEKGQATCAEIVGRMNSAQPGCIKWLYSHRAKIVVMIFSVRMIEKAEVGSNSDNVTARNRYESQIS